ncbi:hypothetical protein K435DRAFT_858627 [Dendrothele bispora CBS 962.96]|uniref:Uncharacterized protein n=1 Tax=Dendrothele bispora (strain CBS 962.96) TaxID=1314807 RepID=A0A4S8M3X9_DENBC|nr:hypothetical protein K435DRAFT_858627 [Dendrothele bispora CBS 962.96]
MDGLRLLQTHTLFATDLEEPNDTQVDESLLDMAIEKMTLKLDNDEQMDEVMEKGMMAPDSGWKPHGSKTMFMLDSLDNLPRLCLSDDHLKAIIWVMKECGTPNVPTFSALCKVQEVLTCEFKLTLKPHKSALENHFYMNHPAALLALDWENLLKHFMRQNLNASGKSPFTNSDILPGFSGNPRHYLN